MAGVEEKSLPEHRQSKLDKGKVKEAVTAILAYHKKVAGEQKKDLLLNESSVIQLQLAVWKISGKKAKTIQINLPHPIRSSSTEACLFTKDVEGKSKEETADHFNQLLEENDVTGVGEVIPLKTYRAEYKPFIARRQLANKYDIFLADDRIFRLMHSHLGKEFYKRKKYPVSVSLTKKNLKDEIEGAINASYFILSNRGDCNHFKVGHTDMTSDQVVENILCGVQSMIENLPKGWPNVKALYVKTKRSISLPIYTSLVFKDWAKDMTAVDNTDVVRLKKQVVSEDSEADAKKKPSSPKKTPADTKKDVKTPQTRKAKKRVLSEKPLANKKQESPSPTEKKIKLSKRRMSGKALKKIKMKKLKTGDSSALKPAELKKKSLDLVTKVKAQKSKMVSKEESIKVSKVRKEKKMDIKQPAKTVGSKRKGGKPKAANKGTASTKKQKMSATSS